MSLVDELVDELSGDELSVDELLVDKLSPHRLNIFQQFDLFRLMAESC
jgi:hypothetical protein